MDEWRDSRPRLRRILPSGRDDGHEKRRRRSETPPLKITATIEEIQTAIESVATYSEVLTIYMYQQEHFVALPQALTAVLLPKLARSARTQKEITDMKQLVDYHHMKSALHRYFLACPISDLIGAMALLMQIRDFDARACDVLVDRAGRHLCDLSGKELSILVDVVNVFAETKDANAFNHLLMQLQQSLPQRRWSEYGDSLPKIIYGTSMLDPDFNLISGAVGFIANNTISYSPQHLAMVAHLCPAEHRSALLDGLAKQLVEMTSMLGPDVVMFCRLLGGCSGAHVDAAFSFICSEVARCCALWDPTQVANSVIALSEQAINKPWMPEHTMLCRTTIPILVPRVQQLSLRHQCKLMSLANICELDSKPFLQAAGHRMKTEHIDQDTAKELILACTKSNMLDENILLQTAKLILPASLVSLAEAAEIAWGMAAGHALKPRSFREMVEPYLDEQLSPSIALHLTEAMCDSHFVNARVFEVIWTFLRTCEPAKNVSLIKSAAVLMRVDAPYCSGSKTPSVSSVDEWIEVMTPLKHPTKGALPLIANQCAKVITELPSDDMASLLLSFAFLRRCPENAYGVFADEAKRRLTDDVSFTSAALCDLLWAFAILLPKGVKLYQIVYEVFSLATVHLMQLSQSLTPFEAINALFAYEILRKRGAHPLVPLGSTYQVLLRPIIVHQQTIFDFHYDVLAQALLSWQQNTNEDLGIPFPEGLAAEAINISQTLRRNELPWRIDKEVAECAREIDWRALAVTNTGLPMSYRHRVRDVCVLLPRPWHFIEDDAVDGSMVFLSQLLTASGFEVHLLSYLKWLALPRRPDSKSSYFMRVVDGNESAAFCHATQQQELLAEYERLQATTEATAAAVTSNAATQYLAENHNVSDTAEHYEGRHDENYGEYDDRIAHRNSDTRAPVRETRKEDRRRRDSEVLEDPVKPRRAARVEDPVRTSYRSDSARVGRQNPVPAYRRRQHNTESAAARYRLRENLVTDDGGSLEQPSTDRRRSRSRPLHFVTSTQKGDQQRSRTETGWNRQRNRTEAFRNRQRSRSRSRSRSEVAWDQRHGRNEFARDQRQSGSEVARDKRPSRTEVARDRRQSESEVARDKRQSRSVVGRTRERR